MIFACIIFICLLASRQLNLACLHYFFIISLKTQLDGHKIWEIMISHPGKTEDNSSFFLNNNNQWTIWTHKAGIFCKTKQIHFQPAKRQCPALLIIFSWKNYKAQDLLFFRLFLLWFDLLNLDFSAQWPNWFVVLVIYSILLVAFIW